MELREIVPGDGIDAPFWPYRVTVTDVSKPRDGVLARVSWSSPEADGVTTLSLRALVRRTWDFRSQATMPAYAPGPSALADAVAAMTATQHQAGIGPFDDYDADATMAALAEE